MHAEVKSVHKENNPTLQVDFVLNKLLTISGFPHEPPVSLSPRLLVHFGSVSLRDHLPVCLRWSGAFEWHSTCCHQNDITVSLV